MQNGDTHPETDGREVRGQCEVCIHERGKAQVKTHGTGRQKYTNPSFLQRRHCHFIVFIVFIDFYTFLHFFTLFESTADYTFCIRNLPKAKVDCFFVKKVLELEDYP